MKTLLLRSKLWIAFTLFAPLALAQLPAPNAFVPTVNTNFALTGRSTNLFLVNSNLVQAAIGSLTNVTIDGTHLWSTNRLIELVATQGYQLTSRGLDADDVITNAAVVWPDGAVGTYTLLTKNVTWLVADAYTITHVAGGVTNTITQPLVLRNANGVVTNKPALTFQ